MLHLQKTLKSFGSLWLVELKESWDVIVRQPAADYWYGTCQNKTLLLRKNSPESFLIVLRDVSEERVTLQLTALLFLIVIVTVLIKSKLGMNNSKHESQTDRKETMKSLSLRKTKNNIKTQKDKRYEILDKMSAD